MMDFGDGGGEASPGQRGGAGGEVGPLRAPGGEVIITRPRIFSSDNHYGNI